MTSGSFKHIAVSSITVNRAERQRTELPDLTSLKQSIEKNGLIHPIVVTREHVLIAGECRLASVTALGWDKIPVQYVDDLSDIALQEIELEENLKRSDIPWLDQARAIQKYHELHLREPDWTKDDTARALRLSVRHIENFLMLKEAVESKDQTIISVPKLSTAIGIVSRNNERRVQAFDATVLKPFPKVPNKKIIHNEDFLTWALCYSGPKFNFIHCDFPYGIGAGDFDQGSGVKHGGYADTKDHYFTLLNTLLKNIKTIAHDSCHILFWLSMRYYNETVAALSTEFLVQPNPLVWMKSDNRGIMSDEARAPRNINEYCLLATRGDRKIVRVKSNGYYGPTASTDHMSEKPQAMLEHFFAMLVDGTSFVLDPTCGNGSALRAAEATGAHTVIGLELNPEYANRAQLSYDKWKATKGVPK